MWTPKNQEPGRLDLLASVSTTLNLWKVEDGQVSLLKKLANTRKNVQNGALPPLTSFDWSAVNPHRIGTASVDTTCTIWNLEKQRIETQLIAHDKAVFDIAFSQESLFASVGADGSVRLFDLRNLEHSTIIYESATPTPCLRLAWNKINKNHIATIAMDALGVILIDIRRPSVPLAALPHHDTYVNNLSWSPHSRNLLLGGTSQGMALLWDIKDTQGAPEDAGSVTLRAAPVSAHNGGQEVYQAQWFPSQPEYMALGVARQVEIMQF
jgi:WD repeat-containing protein 68